MTKRDDLKDINKAQAVIRTIRHCCIIHDYVCLQLLMDI